MRIAWLVGALFLSGILALVHIIALEGYLYWHYVWLDVPMHFLGGLAIGTFLVGFLIRFRPRLYVVLFVLLMLSWEAFEFAFGVPKESNFYFDTSLDLLMDTLGGVTAYAIARTSLWKPRV